jgi:hypothetical protein
MVKGGEPPYFRVAFLPSDVPLNNVCNFSAASCNITAGVINTVTKMNRHT